MYKLSAIACVFLLATACHNQHQETSNYEESQSEELHLNNGEKWIANKETHLGMTQLQELLGESVDSIDYSNLGAKMQDETTYIINNCSMTGTDHDQLHLVLLPMLASISEVKATTDIEAKKVAVDKIQRNLKDYFSHFRTN